MKFNIFSYQFEIKQNKLRNTFWKWLTGEKSPEELYAMQFELAKTKASAPSGVVEFNRHPSSANTGWAPPLCASKERKEAFVKCVVNAERRQVEESPDLSALSDEELGTRMKTAKLGEGVFPEYAFRNRGGESE
jgi:hypothetical protein